MFEQGCHPKSKSVIGKLCVLYTFVTKSDCCKSPQKIKLKFKKYITFTVVKGWSNQKANTLFENCLLTKF